MSGESELQESPWHNNLNFTSARKDEGSPPRVNDLEKYQVVKMMASGDYVCNDQFGNNYLLVCQLSQGGVHEFKSAVKNNFHRSSTNRALLTPFQDIEHGGLKFTAYMLPANSTWIGQAISSKSKSQIYCLSLLYTLINKVLKPLLEIFNFNAQKWLHLENIWVKQSKIFYILNERKKQTNSLKRTQHKVMESPRQKEGLTYEKKLLRKLSQFLLPYYKVDPELRTFLSVIMDALLNQEFSMSEVCLLLNDKTKKRVFMQQKNEKQVDENNELFFVPFRRNDIWNKKKLFVPGPPRRSLVNQTLNIEKLSQWQESTEYYKKQLRNVGQTIDIPPSFQTKKNSFSHSRMFDFKDKSKKRKSLSTERSVKPNKNQNTINVSEDVERKLRTYVKKQVSNSKYGTISLSIQQKAYRKFNQRFDSQKKDSNRYQNFNIQQQDKKLRSYLLSQSLDKKRRASTIQIGNLKNYRSRANENSYETIAHDGTNNKEIMKKIEFQNDTLQKEKNILEELQKQKKQQRERLQKQRFRVLEKQRQLQKQRQKEIQLQKIREREIQREKQQERQRQKERQKEREKEREKERQRQRQKQRQKQKERQRERQRQLQREKEKQLEKQREKQKQQQERLRKIKSNQSEIRKNESQSVIKNFSLNEVASGVNFDQIEIVSPQMKSLLDAKKKQAEQKEREKQKQKMEKNKPPLPSQVKKHQSKIPPIEQEVQEILLESKNRKLSNQKTEKEVKTSEQPYNKPNNSQLKPQPQPQTQQIKQEAKKQRDEVDSQQRTKTVTSEIASSCGPKKPVSKQVAEYMHMINKMGQGVAKSSRISAKLEDIQWFTGIYFIYKRFLLERKKIQKWLEARTPNLTRYQQKNKAEWDEWFNSDQKKTLEEKVKIENENIVSSIIKMNKKIMKKSLPGNFLFHAALSRHSEQQSKIAVSEVVKEYDSLEEKQKLQDDEILTHINQLLNALYIIAELDGKVQQKKPLIQILKKKGPDQLSEFSDFIYDLYIKD